jgi:hypothetical protein
MGTAKAKSEVGEAREERRTVAHMRNRLLGHHCGVSPVEVAAALLARAR